MHDQMQEEEVRFFADLASIDVAQAGSEAGEGKLLQAMWTFLLCSYLNVVIRVSGFILPGIAGWWWPLKGISECEKH